jgi:putative hemolysin
MTLPTGRKHITKVALLIAMATASACAGSPDGPADPPGIANPASVHCEEQGGRLELIEDAEGGQSGVCVLPDGTRCEEWAFYRGECGPTEP